MTEPTSDPATTVELRRVAAGALLGLAGSGLAGIAGFGLAVVITRGLDPGDAGRFFAVTSVFALLVAASTFGTEAGLARFLLRLEASGVRRDLHGAVLWALVPTTVVAVAWAVLLSVHGDAVGSRLGLGEPGTELLRHVAPALPAAVVADVLLATTRGFGRIGPTVAVDRVIRSGLQVALPLLVLVGGGGVVLVATGWAGGYVVAAALAVVAVSRTLTRSLPRRRPVPEPAAQERSRVGARFWSFTWPRGVGALAQLGIQKADIVLVAMLLSPVEAALYAAATRFVPLGQLAVQALQQVLQPRFTAILVGGDRRVLGEVFRVATAWSVLLAWPLYLVVAAAPASYLALFGARYDDARPVVVLMGVAMLVAVATGPVDTLLVMAGRSTISMVNALLALALDLGLCLVLVPRWGITGAAAAWAVAVTTRCGLATWQVHAELGIGPGRHLLVPAALPVACFVPLLVVGTTLAGPGLGVWALSAGTGLAGYVAVLRRLRALLSLDVLTRPPSRPLPVSPPAPPPEESDPSCTFETPSAR